MTNPTAEYIDRIGIHKLDFRTLEKLRATVRSCIHREKAWAKDEAPSGKDDSESRAYVADLEATAARIETELKRR